jgi:hypothetical protein
MSSFSDIKGKKSIVERAQLNLPYNKELSLEKLGLAYTAIMKAIHELIADGDPVRLQFLGVLGPLKNEDTEQVTIFFEPYGSLEEDIEPAYVIDTE